MPLYLASNTAHVNFALLQWIAGDNLQNLVIKVADLIRIRMEPHSWVLIIGTTTGRKHRLYETQLQARNIRYTSVSDDDAVHVQRIIDETKSCLLQDDGKELGVIIKRVIEAASLQQCPISTVLLGCTELGIALRNRMDEIGALVAHVIDTEETFASIMCEDIFELPVESKNGHNVQSR
jgi:aspartate/glutamate racemase